MTILSVIASASTRIIGTAPASVFSSTDQVVVEMRDLVQDVAAEIVDAGEWRALTKIATLSGAETVPLPADYGRMCVGQGMLDPASWFWGYSVFADASEYLMAVNGQIPVDGPGGWIILDGAFKFWPVPSGGATFPYISKACVRPVSGASKATFDTDTDSFILPERLLTLGLIWRYRAQKGLDYTEDLATYSAALDKALNDDKGARILRPNECRRTPGARIAYTGRAYP